MDAEDEDYYNFYLFEWYLSDCPSFPVWYVGPRTSILGMKSHEVDKSFAILSAMLGSVWNAAGLQDYKAHSLGLPEGIKVAVMVLFTRQTNTLIDHPKCPEPLTNTHFIPHLTVLSCVP